MPRFVLLRHECPPDWEKPSHWDFMLEADGVLWTWELRELPGPWATALDLESSSDSNTVVAVRLTDHRLAYLDYEGPVSDARGHVTRSETGSFRWLKRSPEQLAIALRGELVRSVVELCRDQDAWQLSVVKHQQDGTMNK